MGIAREWLDSKEWLRLILLYNHARGGSSCIAVQSAAGLPLVANPTGAVLRKQLLCPYTHVSDARWAEAVQFGRRFARQLIGNRPANRGRDSESMPREPSGDGQSINARRCADEWN